MLLILLFIEENPDQILVFRYMGILRNILPFITIKMEIKSNEKRIDTTCIYNI